MLYSSKCIRIKITIQHYDLYFDKNNNIRYYFIIVVHILSIHKYSIIQLILHVKILYKYFSNCPQQIHLKNYLFYCYIAIYLVQILSTFCTKSDKSLINQV